MYSHEVEVLRKRADDLSEEESQLIAEIHSKILAREREERHLRRLAFQLGRPEESFLDSKISTEYYDEPENLSLVAVGDDPIEILSKQIFDLENKLARVHQTYGIAFAKFRNAASEYDKQRQLDSSNINLFFKKNLITKSVKPGEKRKVDFKEPPKIHKEKELYYLTPLQNLFPYPTQQQRTFNPIAKQDLSGEQDKFFILHRYVNGIETMHLRLELLFEDLQETKEDNLEKEKILNETFATFIEYLRRRIDEAFLDSDEVSFYLLNAILAEYEFQFTRVGYYRETPHEFIVPAEEKSRYMKWTQQAAVIKEQSDRFNKIVYQELLPCLKAFEVTVGDFDGAWFKNSKLEPLRNKLKELSVIYNKLKIQWNEVPSQYQAFSLYQCKWAVLDHCKTQLDQTRDKFSQFINEKMRFYISKPSAAYHLKHLPDETIRAELIRWDIGEISDDNFHFLWRMRRYIELFQNTKDFIDEIYPAIINYGFPDKATQTWIMNLLKIYFTKPADLDNEEYVQKQLLKAIRGNTPIEDFVMQPELKPSKGITCTIL